MVVVLADGSRRKGMIDAFHPARTRLRMQEVDLGGNMLEIHDFDVHEIMAIFFVRELAVHRTHRLADRASPAPIERHLPAGVKVRVTFVWGEMLDGVVYEPPQGRWGGYTIYPLGALGRSYNILRVYVTRSAIARIEVLDAGGVARQVASL